ncbi:hypothetical protein [Xenorhabdus miraniensis]|uniref:hypothetical protein n=2 Tax=Xenorhabdus miraniensis TaxID=351674 RepID=UPI0011AB73C3|nr:hypothetical protein [Xenorhabdus miraniensis]
MPTAIASQRWRGGKSTAIKGATLEPPTILSLSLRPLLSGMKYAQNRQAFRNYIEQQRMTAAISINWYEITPARWHWRLSLYGYQCRASKW